MRILTGLIIVVIISIVIFLGYISFKSAIINTKAKQVIKNPRAYVVNIISEDKEEIQANINIDGYTGTYIEDKYSRRIVLEKDGYIGQAQDINKTRIIGEWIGSHTKEAGKGFFSGLFGKSDKSIRD